MSKKYPIVLITGQDHAIEVSGIVKHSNPFVVFGLLYKEDKVSYIIQNWIYGGDLKEPNNVTSAIVKHPGMKKKVIGWIKLK